MDNLQSAILSKFDRFTNALPTPIRLRDLIRQIRAARTAAEERAVVQKECAYIRSTFREEDNVWRCRNVAKLLYIHMLGYPAHFGQLECLKLIASSRYTDKRIGYLGAMLLLDERQDVHLLITNSVKTDLNSSQQFVVGLALCALGSICSQEMCRDLLTEVEKLMKSNNSYIKKKAALCGAKMVRKLPELAELFTPAAKNFLSEKNHGCLITGITLLTEMCEQNFEVMDYFKKSVHNLVRILKNLIMSGYSPEHDVSGISDPFLQIKILRLLRILGRNDEVTSEAMNDILAQVATNTESSKNVGNAILYETVISIMEIKSESSLRVLGINILGRFLLNTDKNIRYVALTTLLKTVVADYNAVQRHRTTIVECLKDPDISIRKKAMELCFALINSNNIKTMSKELILFIEKADTDFKSICSSNLCICTERYAPDSKWHIDTVIKILCTTGNHVRDDVVAMLIELISSCEELHHYSVCQLWMQLTDDLSLKQPVLQVSMWTIGEFADQLIAASRTEQLNGNYVSEIDIIDRCEEVLCSVHMNLITKEYTLNALTKLTVRFSNQINRIKEIIDQFGCSHSVELQQRSVEFATIFTKHDSLLSTVWDKMPSMIRVERKVETNEFSDDSSQNNKSNIQTNTDNNDANNCSALLDLLDLSIDAPTSTSVQNNSLFAETNNSNSPNNNVIDLLGGLDVPAPTISLSSPVFSASSSGLNDLDSLFGSIINTASTTPVINGNSLSNTTNLLLDDFVEQKQQQQQQQVLSQNLTNSTIKSIVAFNKNNLKIDFSFERSNENSNLLTINLKATNSGVDKIEEFLFQAAVPKSFQLQLAPPSSNEIAPLNGDTLYQVIKVINPNKAQLRMRLRISYKQSGNTITEQADVDSFPKETWQ